MNTNISSKKIDLFSLSVSDEENDLNKSFTDLDLNFDTESRLGTVNFHYQGKNGIMQTMNVEDFIKLSEKDKNSIFEEMKLKNTQKEEAKESKITSKENKISTAEKRRFFWNNPNGFNLGR